MGSVGWDVDLAPEDDASEAACYPDAGSVLIVSTHVSDGTVAPAVAGWQVVSVSGDGEHRAIGEMHTRRVAARAFAEATFTNIVGWEKLGATVLAAQVRPSRVAAPPPAVAKPRRRPNGLRVPLWRS